jgi:DNA-binding NtrC family response regulator
MKAWSNSWPGNVRELENIVQSALTTATDDTFAAFRLRR